MIPKKADYRYCALLRKAYKGKVGKRCYYLLRDDFLKYNRYRRQCNLLWERQITTLDELLTYKENLQAEYNTLTAQRRALYRGKSKTLPLPTIQSKYRRSQHASESCGGRLPPVLTLRWTARWCRIRCKGRHHYGMTSAKKIYITTVSELKAIPHNSRLTAQAPLRRLRHGICVAKMLDKTSSIICAFGLASAAPRSPYRHLELCGIALKIMPPLHLHSRALSSYEFLSIQTNR